MKRITILVLLVVVFYKVNAQVSTGSNLGSKTLYTPQQITYKKAPLGYKATYVNFVGRHGARHLTKEVNVSYAYKTLFKADSLSALTAKGKELKLFVENLNKVEMNKVGSISEAGAKELQLIAKRMFIQQSRVFSKQPNLLVSTTKKGRTKESAEAFMSGMASINSTIGTNVKFNYGDDDNLRFYDFSPTYLQFEENGKWISYYEKLATQTNIDNIANRFCTQFFAQSFLARLKKEELLKFLDDIYGFYTILPAIEGEIKLAGLASNELNFKVFFINDELSKLERLNAFEDYLVKGPGIDKNGIQVKIAAPLLADFINTTDVFIKEKSLNANLRFAHAETIAPFAALLDLQPAATSARDFSKFDASWKANQIIPFSANIQWVFYQKHGSNVFLIKCLLNEKEVGVNGLETKTFPYYNWNNLRKFYLKKLAALGYNLTDNAHTFLLRVK